MPTDRARPARVARINRDHWNTSQFRLVFYESAQFGERPFRHLVSLRLPEPSPFADVGQVFKTDPAIGVCSFLNDLFRDAMIFVRFKPAFLAGERFQLSLDVLRARARSFYFPGLPTQRTSDLILLLAYLFSFGVSIDTTVVVGGKIHRPKIHADKLCRSNLGSFGHVHGNEQKPLSVLTAHEVTFPFCQTESFALILAHNKRDDQTSFQRQNRNSVNALKRQDAAVVGHRGVRAKDGQNAFIPAVSSSDVTNANRRHLCGQVEPVAQFVIEVLLKSDLVGGLPFKGLFGEPGASLVKPLHGGFKLMGLLFVRQKLYLQSQFHQCALYRQIVSIAMRLSPRRRRLLPNPSPPKLEDSLWVENPLAGMLKRQPDKPASTRRKREIRRRFEKQIDSAKRPDYIARRVAGTIRVSASVLTSPPHSLVLPRAPVYVLYWRSTHTHTFTN